jgi:hypothetical protein
VSEVVVADTFFASAGKLAANDRARVFDFLAKFHADPRNPGLHFEKLNKVRDPGIRSARITQGLRAILHVAGSRFTLLYAGQHDDAYKWSEKRTVGTHPKTGVLQIVEAAEETEEAIREEVAGRAEPQLFSPDRFEDAYLLSLSVPESWLPTIRLLRDEDQLLQIAEKLPQEVAERLLNLAAGEVVAPPPPVAPEAPLTSSSDNLRRFWVVEEGADLAHLLNQPLDAWIRFLHPSQRELATKEWRGPVKVTGSAGTGKTVVAMHRARNLASRGQKVLLTTFVTTLCQNIERNLKILCSDKERALITVSTVHAQALRLVQRVSPSVRPVDGEELHKRLERFRKQAAPELTADFLTAEWDGVVEPQGLGSWDDYRDAERRGRGRPLSVRQRKRVWDVFSLVQEDLEANERATFSGLCRRARHLIEEGKVERPYDAILVDELQDLKPAEIRFLAALAGEGASQGRLMLFGDAGQRIYPGGFSLRALGVDVRGRSRVLRINYRTTEQIRRVADRLLGATSDDLDGGAEDRSHTRSLLRGPEPGRRGFASAAEEAAFIAERARALLVEGLQPSDIAVFARTARLLEPIRERLAGADIPVHNLAREEESSSPGINLGSMHRAKGLEFKAVFVAGCQEGTLPLRSVLRRAEDPADREAALAQERSLLYVSLTRARDEATLTWHGTPSPFLSNLDVSETTAA